MQHFIAEHIKEPITQHQLAGAAGYSEYYAARIFRELIGKTPFEYIRKLRLSQSALVLRDEKTKVIDVALDYVFDSHEGFTRAFSKEFGITPKKYARRPIPVQLFMPNNIRDYYLPRSESEEIEMNVTPGTVFVQAVDRPARKLILKRGKLPIITSSFAKRLAVIFGVFCVASRKHSMSQSECGCLRIFALPEHLFIHRALRYPMTMPEKYLTALNS
jgi:AraC-like DNA-binding protein